MVLVQVLQGNPRIKEVCKAFHWYQWDAVYQRLYVVCFKPKKVTAFEFLMHVNRSLWTVCCGSRQRAFLNQQCGVLNF